MIGLVVWTATYVIEFILVIQLQLGQYYLESGVSYHCNMIGSYLMVSSCWITYLMVRFVTVPSHSVKLFACLDEPMSSTIVDLIVNNFVNQEVFRRYFVLSFILFHFVALFLLNFFLVLTSAFFFG